MTEDPPRVSNRNPRRASQHLSSVTTAIHLLKTFSASEPELGISELAKRLNIAKSTVHRLAATMLEEGLLEQNPANGRYHLGIGLFSLGSLVRNRLNVASESKLILHALRAQSGENTRLAVLSGKSVVYIHDFESEESIRLRSITGAYREAYCTAEGLCLLAALPAEELETQLSGELRQMTANTITDPDALREKIARVRRVGYAIEDEEYELGARGIAAPVRRLDGKVIAAISVAGPRERLRKRNFVEIGNQVVAAARQLSERLGYSRQD